MRNVKERYSFFWRYSLKHYFQHNKSLIIIDSQNTPINLESMEIFIFPQIVEKIAKVGNIYTNGIYI